MSLAILFRVYRLFFFRERYLSFIFFFFQAEDGIRDIGVTGVQTCALPISCWPGAAWSAWSTRAGCARDRKSVVEGKSVDLGGRRIIKKKKIKRNTRRR